MTDCAQTAAALSPAPDAPLTIPQFCERYPCFTQAAARWLIFNAKRNGFDRCLIHIGRRVFVDPTRVPEWLASRREVAA
jgi:hypothetical protein